MSILQNKIDFAMIISATNANPNGDPLNGNMPRTTFNGFGEISDVCIKRKLRNRLMDMNENIFVQSDDKNTDGFKSLRDRANSVVELKAAEKAKDQDEFAKIACEKWIDVRSFGQVFAYKGEKDEKNSGVSVGVRGPVSIHSAFSIDEVDVVSTQITKSVNNESSDTGKKSSDTMGMKHRIDFGVYLIKGSINVQLAEKSGFTEEDAEKIKEALRTIFVNDCSSARPDGSMEVIKLYWWKHNCKIGQYSSKKVHDSVKIEKSSDALHPTKIEDYHISINNLESLDLEVYEGI
jgi:CRISPR-associated protein Csd2